MSSFLPSADPFLTAFTPNTFSAPEPTPNPLQAPTTAPSSFPVPTPNGFSPPTFSFPGPVPTPNPNDFSFKPNTSTLCVEALELHEIMKNRHVQNLYMNHQQASKQAADLFQLHQLLMMENSRLKAELQSLNAGLPPYVSFCFFNILC